MADEPLDMRLEAAASEGLDYLLNALRTGNYKADLLRPAQFLVEAYLAHSQPPGDEYTYTSEVEEVEVDEEEDEEDEGAQDKNK